MRNWASDGRPSLFGADFGPPFGEGTFSPWEIELENNGDSATLTTPNRESVEEMGYVQNLSLSGQATSPRVEWDPPAGNEEVDFYQYELWNADEGRVLIGNVIPENIGE